MRGWPGGRGCFPSRSPLCGGWSISRNFGWPSLVPDAEGLEIAATCTITRAPRVRAAGRLAGGRPVANQLRGIPRVVQGLECRDRGRQHLHVPARRADDHHDRGAGGDLPAYGPRMEPNEPSRQRISSSATIKMCCGRGRSCAVCTSRSHALRKRYTYRRFTLTKLGRSTIFMVATQTPATDDLMLTITAGTTHPVVLQFETVPRRRDSARAHRCDTGRRSGSPTPTAHRIIAGTWRSTTPKKSGSNSEACDELHRQRQDVLPGTATGSVPADVPALLGLARRQKGLRRR